MIHRTDNIVYGDLHKQLNKMLFRDERQAFNLGASHLWPTTPLVRLRRHPEHRLKDKGNLYGDSAGKKRAIV